MIYPPIKIIKTAEKDYGVFAQSPWTIIAEYIGDVMTEEEFEVGLLKDQIKKCGINSRLLLLKTSSKDTTLEIVPEHEAQPEPSNSFKHLFLNFQ